MDGYSVNSELTDSSFDTRVIVSARSCAQESWRMRGQACASGDSGIVSVTTISSSSELGDARNRAARQHRVRAVRDDFLRAVLLQRRGRLAQRVRGVDDVVHDHAGAARRRRR